MILERTRISNLLLMETGGRRAFNLSSLQKHPRETLKWKPKSSISVIRPGLQWKPPTYPIDSGI
jgi:hypothetical protein